MALRHMLSEDGDKLLYRILGQHLLLQLSVPSPKRDSVVSNSSEAILRHVRMAYVATGTHCSRIAETAQGGPDRRLAIVRKLHLAIT